ncbi:hypothetical protein V2G26_014772 [Clonostachys chloroleuca]|uniref:Fe2OG dioxygenase domain-containing protein n=1 Tax=Clonostachys chloroleuca TaxID=1926264 RepID=A0AA35QGB2_9HYPO|nr:unnamed protein product [Clonostachys chloroleuca]
MTTTFQSIPVIDFGRLQNEATKAQGLEELRDAIFNVGFLYLVNTGLEPMIEDAHKFTRDIFELPVLDKASCHMSNSPSFLGYSGLREETTDKKLDIREQFDFGTEVASQDPGGEPWRKLEGTGQYPSTEVKAFVTSYIAAMTRLSTKFLHLVAECLSLPPTTFDHFIGNMSRLKFVKYPPSQSSGQGVGAHKDSLSLFTFLSQDQVGGLQVLNKSGEWIDATPIAGSLVVNIAQGFEAATGGLCSATTHRVESPTNITRYSIPFFQAINLDLSFDEIKLSATKIRDEIPVSDNGKKRAVDVPSDIISPYFSTIGEAQLVNRIKSHPEVGKKWYPKLFKELGLAAIS